MRVGHSSPFARVRRRGPGGPPGAGRTLPLRRGARRHTLSRVVGAGAHSPCGEALAGHAVEGGPAQVHAPLAGRRMPVTLWWADRRRCTLLLRGGACRSRCGGRTGVGARSPCGEAHAGHAVVGGPAQVHAPLAGRRAPVTLWWADRRGCTLPLRRGACRSRSWWADRRRCTLPLRRGACRSRCGGRTGAVARSPCEEAHAGHALADGPAQVHALLAERRGT